MKRLLRRSFYYRIINIRINWLYLPNKLQLKNKTMNSSEKTKNDRTILATLSYYCVLLNIIIIAMTIGFCIYLATQPCKYDYPCERPYYEIFYFFAAIACFIVSLIGWLLAIFSAQPKTLIQEKHLALGKYWNKLISLMGLSFIAFFLLIFFIN